MPAISIIVPTFRRPHFLAQALASVRAQTFTDLEVLVCDNAADAVTEQVVRELDDPRFVYVPRPQNLGMLRNAMLGFAAASSPLVMKLDDDDTLRPGALARLVHPFADHPDLHLCFGGVDLVDEHTDDLPEATDELNRTSGRARLLEGLHPDGTRLVASGAVQLAGGVLKADVVDWLAVPDEVATAYDVYLALAAVADGRPAWFTPAPVIAYRLHPEADTARHLGPQALGACRVMERALESGRHTDTASLRRRLGVASLVAGRVARHEGDRAGARSLALRAARLAPGRESLQLLAATLAPTKALALLSRRG
ncbi:glycosyltransferase family 2 protein [Ornithinimicrobium sp. LYQ92]|uniref:glycosyltransferase family 2 protein n=1 Tax=Serinicoccus sp. LYQ92 TaxID=3378798 RepID=UPI003851A91F